MLQTPPCDVSIDMQPISAEKIATPTSELVYGIIGVLIDAVRLQLTGTILHQLAVIRRTDAHDNRIAVKPFQRAVLTTIIGPVLRTVQRMMFIPIVRQIYTSFPRCFKLISFGRTLLI